MHFPPPPGEPVPPPGSPGLRAGHARGAVIGADVAREPGGSRSHPDPAPEGGGSLRRQGAWKEGQDQDEGAGQERREGAGEPTGSPQPEAAPGGEGTSRHADSVGPRQAAVGVDLQKDGSNQQVPGHFTLTRPRRRKTFLEGQSGADAFLFNTLLHAGNLDAGSPVADNDGADR